MSKFTKKIEQEYKVISYIGEFHREDVIVEFNKDIKKYSAEGWNANIIQINKLEGDLTDLKLMLEKDLTSDKKIDLNVKGE